MPMLKSQALMACQHDVIAIAIAITIAITIGISMHLTSYAIRLYIEYPVCSFNMPSMYESLYRRVLSTSLYICIYL